jgi:ACS family hexuronate transporter-like MFS transporter
MATPRIAFTRQQTYLAALLFTMILLNYLDRVVLSLVSPVMRAELDLSQMQYAQAVNSFLVAYGFMYLGSGLILDRIGPRKGLALFVASWSVVCALHGTISGFASLVVWRFLLGVAEPGGWTGAVKTISRHYTAAQRGLASSIFTTGSGIGQIIAPPLVVFVSLHYGWRSAFLIAGIGGLAWIPVWLRVTKNAQPVASGDDRPVTLREALPRLLRNPRALAFVGTRFFGDTTGYFFLFWLPEYLTSSKGFSLATVGKLGWIPMALSDLATLGGGYFSSRLVTAGYPVLFSRKVAMSSAAIFVLLGTLFQAATGTWWVLFSVSLCTIAVGIWSANLHAVPADAVDQSEVASVHGLAGSAGAIGGILFNTLVGYLSARGNFFLVFVVLSMLMPLGVAPLWIWMRDKDPADHA